MATTKKLQPYFSHDSNAQGNEKITRLLFEHGWQSYGIYWAIVEKLRDSDNYTLPTNYNVLAATIGFNATVDMVRAVVEDFGLFVIDEKTGRFYSPRLVKSMKLREAEIKKKSEAGKKAGLISSKRRQLDTQPIENNNTYEDFINERLPNDCLTTAKQEKKSKEKESKGEESKVHLNRPPSAPPAGSVQAAAVNDLTTNTYDSCKQNNDKQDQQSLENQTSTTKDLLSASLPSRAAAQFEVWFAKYPSDLTQVANRAAYTGACRAMFQALTVAEQAACLVHTATNYDSLRGRPPWFYLQDKDFITGHSPLSGAANTAIGRRREKVAQSMRNTYTQNDLQKPFVIRNAVIEC